MKKFLLKIGKWIDNNKLILAFTLFAVAILGYPLIILGVEKSLFYSMDPDVVYITNALLYAKTNIIVYIDHPGTPSIMLLNYLYFPLRLVAKYVMHENFIQWSFDNYAFITYYSRIFQLFISVTGLVIFINLIKKTTKSNVLTITAFFLAYLFTGLSTTLYVRPENFSFFLTACWLVVFTKFISAKKYIWVAILAALSGFIFANKFTGLLLIIFTSLLPFFVKKEKLTMKLMMVQTNVALILESFLLGIWPIRDKIASIMNWGLYLFGHADVHGTGVGSFFDWNTYIISLQNLVIGNPSLVIFTGLSVILALILVIKKKVRLNDPVILLTLMAFVGILIFAKYPVIHYNFINIFLIVYCSIYLISKIKPIWSKLAMITLGVIFMFIFYSNLRTSLDYAPQENPGGVNAVLEQWTPFWSADIFREQLNNVNSTKPEIP
jgi:hypothetical protein